MYARHPFALKTIAFTLQGTRYYFGNMLATTGILINTISADYRDVISEKCDNMRAVVQRVLETQIREGNFITSTVLLGMCISVSFNKNDSLEDLNYIARKVLNLRIFNDNVSNKEWKMNIREKGYGITVLKEKGLITGFDNGKPLFDNAMESRFAYKFYKMFIRILREKHDKELVKGTSFRVPDNPRLWPIKVNVIHDGPAIFVLESPACLKRSPREKFMAAYGLKYYVD